MSHSARLCADYREYLALFGPHLSLPEFAQAYRATRRPAGERDRRARYRSLRAWIAAAAEAELAQQRERLRRCRIKLQAQPTLKGAARELRIATQRIVRAHYRLMELRRSEPAARA